MSRWLRRPHPPAGMGRVRRLVAATALASAAVLAPEVGLAQEEATPETFSCTVAFVIDGDSLNCRDGTRLRLLLINAPEAGPFGDLARRALAGLLPVGESFRVETDLRRQDKEGRVLGYLYLPDGQMVNEMMVREGYAFLKPDDDNRRHLPRLRRAEAAARDMRRGLWDR